MVCRGDPAVALYGFYPDQDAALPAADCRSGHHPRSYAGARRLRLPATADVIHGHGVPDPVRDADDQDLISNLCRVRVSQHGRAQVGGYVIQLQQRHVSLGC